MMMPRKKRRLLLILSIIVILIILAIAYIVVYQKTDMLKTNDVLFNKYATQIFQNMEPTFNQDNMLEMLDVLEKNKLSTETTFKVNYKEDNDESNTINKVEMSVNGQEEKNENYNYKNVKIKDSDNDLMGFECINEQDVKAVRLDKIKQFLSTEKDDNGISELNDLVNLKIEGTFGISDEQVKKISEKYLNIIKNNISNATYSRKKGVTLEIDGKRYDTNSYSMTITKEKFNDVYIKVLEEIKKDDDILSWLDNIDKKINEYYQVIKRDETSNKKDEFVEKVENEIQDIQNSNIGNDERTITVYENQKRAISISIDTEEQKSGIDVINTSKTNYINILKDEKNKDDDQKNSIDFKIERNKDTNNNSIKVDYTKTTDGKEIKNNFTIDEKMENSKVTSNVTWNRKYEKNSLNVSLVSNIDIVNDFENKIELKDNKDNILFDKLNDEQKENVKNSMNNNWNNQTEQLKTVITYEQIQTILRNMKIIKNEAENISSEGTTTEAEKTRFNSGLELFAGEKISEERIEDLINTAKNNLEDIKITKYDEESNSEKKDPLEYKLVIKKDAKNEELANKFITYIKEKGNGTYTVTMEYDQESGLINNIYIKLEK